MKNALLMIIFGFIFSTPIDATPSFIPHMIFKNHHATPHALKKNPLQPIEHTDFSGRWVGTCDINPEEEQELNIVHAPDGSSILIENVFYRINGMTTVASQAQDEFDHFAIHFRMSPNGQKLQGTLITYGANADLATEPLESATGSIEFFMNNQQLIINHEITVFNAGILDSTIRQHCTFDRADKE